jgi:hypothetical protein
MTQLDAIARLVATIAASDLPPAVEAAMLRGLRPMVREAQ